MRRKKEEVANTNSPNSLCPHSITYILYAGHYIIITIPKQKAISKFHASKYIIGYDLLIMLFAFTTVTSWTLWLYTCNTVSTQYWVKKYYIFQYASYLIIDPLCLSPVMAGNDHYFSHMSWCVLTSTHSKISPKKQTSSDHYWRDCGCGWGDHWWRYNY